jgi:hypothetical protein
LFSFPSCNGGGEEFGVWFGLWYVQEIDISIMLRDEFNPNFKKNDNL